MEWCPFAIRRDGHPSDKHGGYASYSEPHQKRGLVAHSMAGALPAALGGLDNAARRASWTFSNPKSGPLLQHYPLGSNTWASGSAEANSRYTSVEHEGGGPGNEGEPLTENQIDNLVKLIRWLSEQDGWTPIRPGSSSDTSATLWEHKEMIRFGSAPTACPSGRIPWAEVLRRLEVDVTIEEVNKLKAQARTAAFFAGLAVKANKDEAPTEAEKAALRFFGA